MEYHSEFKWEPCQDKSRFPSVLCIHGEYTALVQVIVPDALGNSRKWTVERKNVWIGGGHTLGSQNGYDACEAIMLIDMRHREDQPS